MATTIKYSELNAWLASQVENTASTPYEIIVTELTDADLVGFNDEYEDAGIRKILLDNSTKYVAIKDLQGTVTSIGNWAFGDCTSLTSIEIPESVTSIGDCAFHNTGLTSIEIPESVTSIYVTTFNKEITSIISNTKISNIIVSPNNPKYDSRNNCNAIIETTTNNLIVGCKNTIIPDNVVSIGRNAFAGCIDLVSINIPDDVTSIGNNAFANCENFKTLYIGKAIEVVRATMPIETVIWTSNPTYIGDYAFRGCNSLTSIVIPDSVTSIGNYAFQDCYNLTSIEIPDSVIYIEIYAFYNCTSLTSIEIPESVTYIGNNAFRGCNSLTNIKIYGNPKTGSTSFYFLSTNFIVNPEVWTQGYSTSLGGATSSIFYDFDGNLLTPITPTTLSAYLSLLPINTLDTPYEITITNVTNTDLEGDDVTPKNIQKAIKDNITKFVSIKVEGEVTAIGDSAFADCNNLVDFEIPNTVTILGKGAFYNTGITEITVPGSVTEMDCYYLFAECTYLRKITFNNGEISPTNVGSMFQECINLKEVNLLWLNTENVTDYSDMFVNDTIDVYVNHYIWTLGTDDPQFSNATEITWHDVRLEMEITDGIEDSEVYYGVVKVLRVNAIANFGSAVITYQWYKNDILMDTVTGNSFTYVALEDGTYKCVVTATLGDDSVTKTTEGTITVVPYYDEGTKIIVHGSQTVRGDIYIHGEIQGDFMKSILDRIEALEQRN